MIELSRELTIPLMNASTWSLECVWPHYNPRLVSSVSYVYDHLHTMCFGKSGCILYVCLHMLPTGPSAIAHVRSLLIVNEDWYPWALTLGLGFPGGSRSHWSFGSHVLLDKLLSQHSIGRLNGPRCGDLMPVRVNVRAIRTWHTMHTKSPFTPRAITIKINSNSYLCYCVYYKAFCHLSL